MTITLDAMEYSSNNAAQNVWQSDVAPLKSYYPPTMSTAYVKATSETYPAWYALNPAYAMTGSYGYGWLGSATNMRFHIDLGNAQVITRIHFENAHDSGTKNYQGVKDFTFWGSNTAGAFTTLTYGTDTNWVQLTTNITQMPEHVAADQSDPYYINVTNTTAYRYYAFKFANNWGDASYMGVRRIELQGLTSYTPHYPPNQSTFFVHATSEYYYAYYTTTPYLNLTGPENPNSWVAAATTNQRFNIDLGAPQVITRVYYEPYHESGIYLNIGAQHFTFWGSNTYGDWADTTYADDGTWVQLTTDISALVQHVASDTFDPHYINVTNTTAYRYYCFKIADNWGNGAWLGIRRIELQSNPLIIGYSSSSPITTGSYSLEVSASALPSVTNYQSWFPPAQSATYVKATSTYNSSYYPYFATSPNTSVYDGVGSQAWIGDSVASATNQRFHIDLGSAIVINRIYYENYHDAGGTTSQGVQHFTFWGSNNAAAFADLTYGDDTNWTQLTCDISAFAQHISVDRQDPRYANVTNSTAYRYYAFKFADNWGGASWMGVRRIELQSSVNTSWYTSVFPPGHNPTYVLATTTNSSNYLPQFATDPSTILTGDWTGFRWLSNSPTNQRFHMDLGTRQVVTRIYYENLHSAGAANAYGVKDFTFYGSNTASDFSTTTYATTGNWVQLTTDVTQMSQHKADDVPDQRYVYVTNSTPYRYYAFKFATGWTGSSYMGLTRVELQISKYSLIRTLWTTLDLTAKTVIDADIYASRTGSNITLGIDNSGLLTTTTPNITNANQWQTAAWDISGVTNANKNSVNRLLITIADQTVTNTFYVDNMYSKGAYSWTKTINSGVVVAKTEYDELKTNIDNARGIVGLGGYSWTHLPVTQGGAIANAVMAEMRTAIDAAHDATACSTHDATYNSLVDATKHSMDYATHDSSVNGGFCSVNNAGFFTTYFWSNQAFDSFSPSCG